ncbi:hypothetical protein [Parerythrobacter jejuensis]|uniref:Uncharacterized protein n=1 Tax=Parerythrobacter jejuensis TaxID=795812 RepID=A0A845ATV8_9SPHN|nr:hypothetical protein [Parerythrobacter jejuensis]MXP30990.1 hypothetical protein [Parerythrobacter jejuensis]MXP33750.1 hypothetical protein [Parerythrobacter jejuensis]
MMMNSVAMTLAAIALQAAPADEPVQTPEKLENISIPQEISPALMPYLTCRQTEQGIALYDDDGNLMNPREAKQDCAPLREKARGKTIGILKDLMLGRNRTERAQIADYWLGRIDSLSGPTET